MPHPRRIGAVGPAGIIALIALVVALGGTATAARTLITGRDIANGAIQSRHLAPSAVTLPKIAPAAQFSLRGRQGPAGAQGAQGPAGPAGGFDLAKLTRIVGPEASVPAGQLGTITVACPAGHRVTGGGFGVAGYQDKVFASAPNVDGTSWIVLVDNRASPISLEGSAYALCVAP